MSIDDFTDTPPERTATPTVSQAVERLCSDCAERWKDYLHARHGLREADHRSRQLAQELRIAVEGQYFQDDELHALSTETDNAARLLTVRTIVAEHVAEDVARFLSECLRCHGFAEVLFPGVLLVPDFGGEL